MKLRKENNQRKALNRNASKSRKVFAQALCDAILLGDNNW